MTLRGIMAGTAALALALLTLPVDPSSGHAHAHAEEAGFTTEVCDAEARPADFNFQVQDMNGEEFDFESLKGKVVLLNFWATWCGPCKVEVPWFVEFLDEYGDDGLAVVGVSIDDTADKIQEFSAEYDVDYPMLVGVDREDVQESFGPIWGVPMTFFIDREGILCRSHAGIATKDEFEKDISDLL